MQRLCYTHTCIEKLTILIRLFYTSLESNVPYRGQIAVIYPYKFLSCCRNQPYTHKKKKTKERKQSSCCETDCVVYKLLFERSHESRQLHNSSTSLCGWGSPITYGSGTYGICGSYVVRLQSTH